VSAEPARRTPDIEPDFNSVTIVSLYETESSEDRPDEARFFRTGATAMNSDKRTGMVEYRTGAIHDAKTRSIPVRRSTAAEDMT
jgi:hypothetical protein